MFYSTLDTDGNVFLNARGADRHLSMWLGNFYAGNLSRSWITAFMLRDGGPQRSSAADDNAAATPSFAECTFASDVRRMNIDYSSNDSGQQSLEVASSRAS